MVSKVITTHVCQVRSSKVHVMYFLQAYGVYIYMCVCIYVLIFLPIEVPYKRMALGVFVSGISWLKIVAIIACTLGNDRHTSEY